MSNCDHRFGIGNVLFQIHEDKSISFHSYIYAWEIKHNIIHHYHDEYENVTFNGIKVLQYWRDKLQEAKQQQQQNTEKEQIQQEIKSD